MTKEELWNLEETQHLKSAWENFALQQCEKLSAKDKVIEKYQKILQTIASWEERIEDYYGGVFINWSEMCHDMIDFAKNSLNEGDVDETK